MHDFSFTLDIVKALSSVKSGDRVVVGYASTFDVDSDNTQITKQALEGAKDDLLTYSTVLFNHDMDRPIGKVIETEVDDIGLLVKVILSKEEDEIWKKIDEGIINKFSIKGRAVDLSPTEGDNQILQINKIELFEVSLVSVPANKEAYTISHWIAKSLELTKDAEVTSNVKRTNMKDLIEKLKVILGKENIEEVKTELDSFIKNIEKGEDIIEKLQVVSGKLSGDDKEVVDNAVDMLKVSRNMYHNDQPIKEESVLSEEPKKYELTDESDLRPVFQMNGNNEDISLGDDNKFRKQVLKFGKWFHWDADGGVLNITDEVVDNIVKNFKKSVIEHVYVPLSHTTDPIKNAGEVIELQKTENGLDAIIEIKDETIAEKIKKGLIKCISARLDPNYRVKTSNKFVGPTLLHTALVSEPFIKGMGNFVPLSEDFEGRNIIQLEDEEPNFYSLMKALKEVFEESGKTSITPEMFAEEFAKLRTDIGLSKQIEEAKEEVEEKIEDKKEEVIEDKKEEIVEDKKEEVIEVVESAEDIEKKKKKEPKEGDTCSISGKAGKYVKDGEKMTCVAMTSEELKEHEKKSFQTCMSREMKAGKTMAEAAKTCKAEVNKTLEETITEESSEEKSEDKSDSAAQQLDFADAERVYEGYLAEGKITPAQKDTFIKLMTTGKKVELGDDQVDVSELLKTFMESQSQVINFDEDGVVVDEGGKKEDKDKKEELADIPSDVKEFYGKMGITSDEGIKKSWGNLQELKKEAEDNK